MSSFEEAIIQRIKQLEREVERLQRWERLNSANFALATLDNTIFGVDQFQKDANYSTHFDVTTPTGFTWNRTPKGLAIIEGSWLRLNDDSGIETRLERTVPTGYKVFKAGARFAMDSNSCIGGLRIDDGTDNNVVKLYIAAANSGHQLKLETIVGGDTPATTNIGPLMQLGQPISVRYYNSGSSAYVYVNDTSSLRSSYTAASIFSILTRASVFIKASQSRHAYFDYFYILYNAI